MLRYQEIKKMLIDQIASMNPGDRLPSRSYLCKELQTTRTTLDRAIKELEKEKVVCCQNGSGTYVIGLIDGASPQAENWCVIVPNVMDDIYPSLVRGIENIAQVEGANVIICNSDNDGDKQDRYIRRLLASGVAGFIIVPVITGTVEMSYKLYGTLLDSNIPFVFCNRGVEGIKAPLVKSNDFYGGYIATKLLIERGYKNIAYIAKLNYQTSMDRCQGYISALLESDIEINRNLIILPRYSEEANCYKNAKRLIDNNKDIDAVFCFNDDIAQDVCRAIEESGKRISDDIGVIGYDNNQSSARLPTPLSSVSYKSLEIGEKAATVLANNIKGINPSSNFEYYLFQPTIVERESCKGKRMQFSVHNKQLFKEENK